MALTLFLSVAVVVLIGYFFYKTARKNTSKYIIPGNIPELLADRVAFYQQLGQAEKQLFERRVEDFLRNIMIRGVDVEIEDTDRTLVAAGAIIPIFAFPDWTYNNLSEVLLYRAEFNKDFDTDGGERNILGMVGDGTLHREMLLSLPSLRSSFQHKADGENTVIHEFTHLIDKADGAADGIPEYLLTKPYILPWIKQMHLTIRGMKAGQYPDINIYGATNDAEFLAVVAEYFFEKPDELAKLHPELYGMLQSMFTSGSVQSTALRK